MIKSKKTLITTFILAIGILILLNILSNRMFVRVDLTEDNRYTLSDATKDILTSLNEPVTVTAYFSKDLPPDIENLRTDFKDLLIEYSNISKGMVEYEFINPNENEETENEAVQAGVFPLQINMREKDQIKVQKAYLGAVIQLGEDSEVIPVMQSSEGMEYSLSTTIKKISVVNKPVIAILQGHGEPELNKLQQVVHQLNVLYQVETVSLTDSTYELEKYNTVAIVSPTDSFPMNHLQQLERFLAEGKNLFVAINRVNAELNKNQNGFTVNTGLENWLSSKGINVNDNFLIDDSNVGIRVQMQQGPFVIPMQVAFPYFPLVNNFEDHPITKGLEQVIMQFASTINFSGDSSIHFTPIVKSSGRAGTESSPTYFNVQRQWNEADFPLSDLTIGAVAEGKLSGNASSRMVVIADGDFAINQQGGNNNQINPDNVSLMANSIDWLSDDTGLIELRTKGATARPLDELEDGKRAFLKYFNFLLPILLVIIYGVIRFQLKQTLRIKRMEADYV